MLPKRPPTYVALAVLGGALVALFLSTRPAAFPEDRGLGAVIEWSKDAGYFECVAETIVRSPGVVGADDGFELVPGEGEWQRDRMFGIRTGFRTIDATCGERSFRIAGTLDPIVISLDCD